MSIETVDWGYGLQKVWNKGTVLGTSLQSCVVSRTHSPFFVAKKRIDAAEPGL